MSWGVGSKARTIGWMYSDLKYSYLCYMATSCSNKSALSYNTYPQGIDFSDRVVGYYTSTTGTWGFIDDSNGWSQINDTHDGVNNYTIVRGIDPDQAYISGWTEDTKTPPQLHGFVACKLTKTYC